MLQIKTKVIGGTSPEDSHQLMDLIPTNTPQLAGIAVTALCRRIFPSLPPTTPNPKRKLKGRPHSLIVTSLIYDILTFRQSLVIY